MRTVQNNDVRPFAVAGYFYPAQPNQLDATLSRMLDNVAQQRIKGEIKALIAPHAGYQYSGQVAAAAYKQIQDNNYDVIAIISPSHQDYFPGISVFNGRGYATPLGMMPVATELANGLIDEAPEIMSSWLGHGEEHALEVQVPFLQKLFPVAKIIPLVIGRQDYKNCRILGRALANVLRDESALIVATSDLSHYYSYQQAVELDNHTIGILERFNARLFASELDSGGCKACGGGPIVSAMVAAKKMGAKTFRTVLYQNSGDVTGDYSKVVGYLSAVFLK